MERNGTASLGVLFKIRELVIDMDTISKLNVYFLIIIYPLLPIIKEHSLMVGNIVEIIILLVLFLGGVIYDDTGGWKISIQKNIFFATLILITGVIFYLSDFFDTEVYDVFSAARVFLFYIFLIGTLNKLLSEGKLKCESLAKTVGTVSILFAIGAVLQFVIPDSFLTVHNSIILTDLRDKSDFIAFSIFNRVFSFLNDPNVFGVFSSFCFFICFNQYRKIKNRLFLIAIMGSVISILLSQSRTAIILIGVFFILRFLLSLFSGEKIKPLQILCIVLILGSFAYLILVNLGSIFEYLRVDTLLTGNGRVANSAAKLSYIIDQEPFELLFGNGMGIAREIVFENSYLLLVYQLGIFGFLIFGATVVLILGKYLKNIKSLPIILGYFCAIYVGDYILIPQITYLFIIAIMIMRYSAVGSVDIE